MDIHVRSVKAKRKQILNEFQITLPEGNSFALLGRNGSGKSTLLNAITKHPALQIDVDITGTQLPLFMGFQKPVEVPEITTMQLLLYLDSVYGAKTETIDAFVQHYKDVLNELSITPELLEHPLNQNVSGGENKCLELLQLYIIKPAMILLDEIDTGLDLDNQIIIGRFLKKYITKYKPTVLIVTHNIDFLKYFQINQVFVLDQGNLLGTFDAGILKQISKTGFLNTFNLQS